MVVRSRLSDVPAHDHSLCHEQLKRKRTDSKRHLANDNDRLIENTNPIVPRGGFLQVAVSEAPPTQRLNSQLFARGRSRYSTRDLSIAIWRASQKPVSGQPPVYRQSTNC